MMNVSYNVMPKVAFTSIARRLTTASNQVRTPSIKFIGKRSHDKVIASHPMPVKPVVAEAAVSKPINVKQQSAPVIAKKVGNGIDFTTLKERAWHGRPKLSEAEIHAITTGGAIL